MTQRRSPRRAATVAALALAAAVVPLPDAPPAGTAYAAVAPASGELRAGDSGPEVEAVQERLAELGYWTGGADGAFGTDTALAVQALQKAAGIDRDGIVGPDTRGALDDGVRPSAETADGRAVEIDLDRQLLMTVEDGEVQQVFSTSTGSGEPYTSRGERHIATTPTGSYQVFREVDAWDPGPLGALYRPKYFNGGIAVHGYGSVPPYPASHGCARVSLKAMDWLWKSGHLDVYDTVLVR
ncbi:L,D-transpeptidase family protein [Nocardiopsis chromatogenes]|uniref:L,D-transpeptidase family protein n=1 Tax=Nocardiopsis chromatogenes TaxID=280239 RepID=UPI0004779935|nr:L,D-transpeptidase family protein [Nocardiopsis chromatogenes]